jgi:hypothetical protein
LEGDRTIDSLIRKKDRFNRGDWLLSVVGWCLLGLMVGLTVFYACWKRKLGGEYKARLKNGVEEWINNQKMEKDGVQSYRGVSGVRFEDWLGAGRGLRPRWP